MSNRFFAFLLIFLVAGSGCGTKLPPGMPKLYPTDIRVQYQGDKPCPDAVVTFFPEEENASIGTWVFVTQTDDQGKASMVAQGKYPGMPAGKFKVTIARFVTEGQPMPPEPDPRASVEERKEYQRKVNEARKSVRYATVEEIRTDRDKTPVRHIEVKPGKNLLTIDAGKEVRIPKPLIPLGR